MSSHATNVHRILQHHYVNDGSYSHVSLILPRGKYGLLSRPLLDQFWHEYCTALLEPTCAPFGLAEVPQSFIPVLVDVDLKFSPDCIRQETGHFYSEDLVRKLILVYQQVLRDLIVFQETDDPEFYLTCVWLDKDAYLTESGQFKNGFHLHFPHLFVSRIEQETRLIPAVKKFLDEHFEQFGVDASIIDSKAVGNTWLLYGSVKSETMKPYKVARVYDAHGEPTDTATALAKSILFNGNEEPIALTPETVAFFYPRIFSIVAFGRKHFEIRKQEPCLRTYACPTTRVLPTTNVAGARQNMSQIRQLVELLSARRAEGHDDWMNIGWALYNITNGSEQGLDVWIKFSLQTDDHDEDRCIYEWARMTNRGTYTIGTLKHFARQDNTSGYNRLMATLNKERKDFSEYGLAEMFHELCPDAFAYSDRCWYVFGEHFWEEDREGLTVRTRLIEVLSKQLHLIRQQIVQQDDQYDPSKDPVSAACAKLHTVKFVNSVFEFAKQRFLRKGFQHLFNQNPYLVGFQNGVYDLRQHEFRRGKPEDMICNHSHLKYRTFEESDPEVVETHQFFEKVLPNPNIRRYFMDVMSEVFIGHNHRKEVYFWTGEANNGKSTTQMFFSKMLGPLCAKAPTTLITSKRGATGSANAEMARLGNGVLFLFLEEPDDAEEIYPGTFKHLSGNDEFYARDLYQSGKDVREIRPMFTFAVICNGLPTIRGGGDVAVWNRVCVIPFNSTFSHNAPADVEEQWRTNTFPIDTTLEQRIPHLAQALAWILLEHLKKPKGPKPQEVIAATLDYQTANDFFASFLSLHVEEDSQAIASKFDLYDMYKEFCRDSCAGKRPMTFMEFMKRMTKKWGALNAPNGDGWVGYRVKSANTTNTSEISELLS